MLAWELIAWTSEAGNLWRHCWKCRSYLLITQSPSQTCHGNPNSNQQAPGRYNFFPVGRMPTAKSSLAWRLLSEKSGRCGIYGRLRSVALYLWLIVVSVRQSTVATISGLHCRALVVVSSSIRLTAWLQNSKKRAETVREIDVWAKSPRLSPALVICIIVCLSWAGNHYRDNAITYKAQRDKMPENWSWRTWCNCADASAWCCCARCKIHEGVSWC